MSLTNKIGKIAVGVSGHKQSYFDISHDKEDTMNFGEVRCLMSKEMKPNSKISMKKSDLVMTAPFNVFTYGDMDYETISMFVPRHKIFERLDSFLSGEATPTPSSPSNPSVPKACPSIIAGVLASFQLIGSKFSVWRMASETDMINRLKEEIRSFGWDSGKNAYVFDTLDPSVQNNAHRMAQIDSLVGILNNTPDKLLVVNMNDLGVPVLTSCPNPHQRVFKGVKAYTWLNLTLLNYLIQKNNYDASNSIQRNSLLETMSIYLQYLDSHYHNPTTQAEDGILWIPLSSNIASAMGFYESDSQGNKSWIDPQANKVFWEMNTHVPEVVDPDSADITIPYHYKVTIDGVEKTFCAIGCFKLSDAGRRFRSLLQSLEMPTDIGCMRPWNCERLLAWSMAYYESFGIQTTTSVYNTPFGKLLQRMRNDMRCYRRTISENLVDDDMAMMASMWAITASNEEDNCTLNYILSLFDSWLTDSNDFASVHTNTSVGLTNDSTLEIPSSLNELYDFVHKPTFGFGNGQFISPNSGISIHTAPAIYDANSGVPVQDASAVHSALDAKLLMKLAKWTNRQSILGHDIEKQLKALGYGNVLDLFGAEFIGKTSNRLEISQVPALADTYSEATKEGKELGELGAKSISYDSSQRFTYETKNGGYWITMCYIRPISSYSQSVDCEGFDVYRDEQYIPEFDGLGMENTPVSQFFNTSRMVSVAGVLSDPSLETFGLVPRDSHRKVTRDVLSGGFALPSERNTYSAYHLNRFTPLGDHTKRVYDDDQRAEFGPHIIGFDRALGLQDIPRCGVWTRSPYRYEWLCQLERIFARNHVSVYDEVSNKPVLGDFTENWFIFSQDNFIVHTHINGSYDSCMKPLSVSWETFDDEKGANGAETKA